MKYSKSKLALDVAKEIGKDSFNLSKNVTYGTARAIKGYGKFCYDIYLGSMGSVKSGEILPDFMRILMQTEALPTLAVLSIIFTDAGTHAVPKDVIPYAMPAYLAIMCEPYAKECVRAVYRAGKNYVKDKIQQAQSK